MECNKENALRALEISEAKLAEKDFVGAKKFAQKAEKLFHGLEGVSQLLVILDVYISSEKKINGEPDWYGVLGVGPTADEDTIRKNYKRLALYLHPDKNKSVGAEGAFKLVSQAWTLLSDQVRRRLYEQKRNPRPVYQPVYQPIYQPVNLTQPVVQSIPRPVNPSPTFWTSCPKCSMHFEYVNNFINQKLACLKCREPFSATPVPAPPMNHHSTMTYGPRPGRSLNPSGVNHVNVPKGPSFNTSAVNRFKNRREARIAEMRYQASNSGLGLGKSDGILKRKRVDEQASVHVSNPHSKKVNMDYSRKELSQTESRNLLMKMAKNVILGKMDELKAKIASKKVFSGVKYSEETIVKTPLRDTVSTDDMDVDVDADVAESQATLMSVPDPDFHDFDMDRTERSFVENEVWAAYDDDDGMPRYYAIIHRVVTRNPFKMEISWLNSKTNAEFGPVNWVSSGFTKTSGDYRMGKHETNTSLNSFSHKVQCAKGKKGVIHVYPKKGNVWAVYKNWSCTWNEFTPDEVIHDYEMVTVLDDFDEEKGVVVAPLVKVPGYKSVFRLNGDVAEARTIPKDEIFRLSHQVPFHVLTGEESVNVPGGCYELDPAALPLELLQTTPEPQVKAVEDGSCKKTEVEGMITYFRKKAKKV